MEQEIAAQGGPGARALRSAGPGSESCLCHFLAVQPWANYQIILFRFLFLESRDREGFSFSFVIISM